MPTFDVPLLPDELGGWADPAEFDDQPAQAGHLIGWARSEPKSPDPSELGLVDVNFDGRIESYPPLR